METTSFRAPFGQMLTIAVGVIVAVSLTLIAVNETFAAFAGYTGPAMLALATTWAMFWRPSVDVGDDAVIIHNIAVTITIPWHAIEWVDTKYALTLGTPQGKFAAWAAPAPGFVAAKRAAKADRHHMPASTYAGGSIRPGDLASSPSGQAAIIIRRELERREYNSNDKTKTETGTGLVSKVWNWDVIAIVSVFAVWTAIAVLV